jgi:hypothetical protein
MSAKTFLSDPELNSLSTCLDVAVVDLAFDAMGFDANPELRATWIYKFLKVDQRQSFSCGGGPDGFTGEDKYSFAKEMLVSVNEGNLI